MNELITKQFENNQIRVITGHDGEPWFVGKDIADALGYKKSRNAINSNCKSAVQIGGAFPEGSQGHGYIDPQTLIIPERDVYRLIMRSKLPSAEKFEEWVVSEVLPLIRKSGSYSLSPSLPDFSNPAEAARAWATEFEAKQIAQQLLLEAAPKVAFVDKYVDSTGLYAITQIAKTLKFKRKDLIEILVRDEFLFRRAGRLEPYASVVARGLCALKTGDANGHVFSQVYFTPKGLQHITETYMSELAA